jgi:hypothetical protein
MNKFDELCESVLTNHEIDRYSRDITDFLFDDSFQHIKKLVKEFNAENDLDLNGDEVTKAIFKGIKPKNVDKSVMDYLNKFKS